MSFSFRIVDRDFYELRARRSGTRDDARAGTARQKEQSSD